MQQNFIIFVKTNFMATFHPLKVKDIVRETKEAVSLCFDVPEALKAAYEFKAGQYLSIEALIDGKNVRRDYSISASPNSGELTVTVKEVDKGVFSTFANRKLKKGEVLNVATPQGRFTFSAEIKSSKPIVAFAAGSGITPIISIIKTVLEETLDQNCILIYGNKTPDSTIFHKKLKALESDFKGRLNIQFMFSQARVSNADFGRIDKLSAAAFIKNITDLQNCAAFYLCGPEAMIQTVKSVLTDCQIPENKILFELFTASEVAVDKNIENNLGAVKATILFDDASETITMASDITILEAALAEDLDVPYSCQGGVCSSCICRIKEGTAEMRQNSILTESEVAEGLVLSCQAVPTSQKIYVDFDDV